VFSFGGRVQDFPVSARTVDREGKLAMEFEEPAGTEEAPHSTAEAEYAEELLVEEVSIDGMCGVY
jgi:mycofactocin precursor